MTALLLVTAIAVAAPQGPPVFDATVDAEKLAVLCDPVRFRFSVRASADAASVDRS